MKPKLIVIVGPTASGKTALGIRLARRLNGEIISADSRQVYKGLNLSSGKVARRETQGIRHYCLDLVSPKTRFSADDYRRCFLKALHDIQKRGKIPIVVGGTGFYIDVALGRMNTGGVPPNPPLRKKLSKKSAAELFKILKKLDPKRANAIDRHNSVRLIRAIEIARAHQGSASGVNCVNNSIGSTYGVDNFDVVWIGIAHGGKALRKKIHTRLMARMKAGMVEEIKKLHRSGIRWKRLDELGLEPRWIARYLRNKITREQMLYHLENAIWRYSKRQITWFKKNKKVRWIANLNDIYLSL